VDKNSGKLSTIVIRNIEFSGLQVQLRLNKSIEYERADKTSSADYAVNAIAVALGVTIPESPQIGLSEI